MQNQSPTETQLHMEITAMEQLADVLVCLQRQLQQWHVAEEKQMDLKLCIMEAIQNALLHGGTESESARAQIVWRCTASEFWFTVEDNGNGVPYEIRTGAYEERLLESGRGVLLMRTILDEVTFNEKGNAITGVLRW